MLGKMLKQDFKATSRLYIPIILGFIGMCIINKFSFEIGLTNQIDNDLIQIFAVIFMAFYVLAAIALGIVTQIFIAMDFYKTMTGNQGYLTHTLPVKTSTIINSKLLIAVFWQIVTTLLIVLSVLLLIAGHVSMAEWSEFTANIYEFFSYLKISPVLLLLEFLFTCIMGVFYTPLMYYVSIAIGHLFQKHRLGASILSFFVIYFVLNIATSIINSMFGLFANINTNDVSVFWSFYHKMLLVLMTFSILTSIGFYVATNIIFSKKLNLE